MMMLDYVNFFRDVNDLILESNCFSHMILFKGNKQKSASSFTHLSIGIPT